VRHRFALCLNKAAAEEPSIAVAELPQDLSPWGMFVHADQIVKAVMIGLAIASLVTWTVWVAKSLELFGARGRTAARTTRARRVDHIGASS
jgi:biopolymer transport protein ExbB